MKKSTFQSIAALAVVALLLGVIFSCRKNSGTTDLVIIPPKIPGERQLTVSVLNTNQDTLKGYTLTVKSPSGTTDNSVTSATYQIKNPVSGSYTFTVKMNGYVSASKTVTVTLPTDETVSMLLNTSLYLTNSAPAVPVTASTGATIPVKEDAVQPSSAVVAQVAVPAATTFTLADGSKPASVNITVTNVPTDATLAPVVTTGGQQEVALQTIEIVNQQIPIKKLDLQPEGMTFSKPMVISMYIGDLYTDLIGAAKISAQASLAFNYVRTDGTVEVVNPDHFSQNRDSVYFKISHFSNWFMVDNRYQVSERDNVWFNLGSQSAECGEQLNYNFSYSANYNYGNAIFKRVLEFCGITLPLSNQVIHTGSYNGVPGYKVSASLEVWGTEYTVKDKTTNQTYIFNLLTESSRTTQTTSICHNQGGTN